MPRKDWWSRKKKLNCILQSGKRFTNENWWVWTHPFAIFVKNLALFFYVFMEEEKVTARFTLFLFVGETRSLNFEILLRCSYTLSSSSFLMSQQRGRFWQQLNRVKLKQKWNGLLPDYCSQKTVVNGYVSTPMIYESKVCFFRGFVNVIQFWFFYSFK